MSKWSTSNIPDLNGKLFLITGANSGLGFEASKQLARHGAKVIMACRNIEKATIAVNRLKEDIPQANIEFMQLDLASLSSIHNFAENFKEKYNRLDVLLNNAGIMFGPYLKTEDGFESTFGTNYLGHFALTALLIETIKETADARVVNVSSLAHVGGEINFDDLMPETKHDSGKAYSSSKLALILFTNELQRRFEKAGIDCKAVSLNPGLVKTEWLRHMRQHQKVRAFLIGIGLRVFGQSVEVGALTLLRAAVDPNVTGGEYFSTAGKLKGYPIESKSHVSSYNEEDVKNLWELSENLTDITYSI